MWCFDMIVVDIIVIYHICRTIKKDSDHMLSSPLPSLTNMLHKPYAYIRIYCYKESLKKKPWDRVEGTPIADD